MSDNNEKHPEDKFELLKKAIDGSHDDEVEKWLEENKPIEVSDFEPTMNTDSEAATGDTAKAKQKKTAEKPLSEKKWKNKEYTHAARVAKEMEGNESREDEDD